MSGVGGDGATPPEVDRGTVRRQPLVEPIEALAAEAGIRAQRQVVLPGFGDEAQRRLANARVLVIGAGGLGCASVPFLAGAGVGRIGLLDDDVVEMSNLHRQTTHRTSDIGRMKVDALAETVHALDPNITVDRHRLRLSAKNALDLFAEYDLVLDGSDNFPTRYLTNDAADLTGTPLVWGAILQYSGQVGVAWHSVGPGYRDLFPTPPAPEGVLSCAVGGVLPGLCGTIGTLMATEALKLITGIGEPLLGRVLLYDALAARTREILVNRDPSATPITELVDYEMLCGTASTSTLPASRGVSAEAFAEALRTGGPTRVLDVRSAEEFAERRVRGAVRCSVDDIESGDIVDLSSMLGSGADGPIWVYCERDPRSIRATEALISQGIDEARFVRGGISRLASAAPDLIVRGEAGARAGGARTGEDDA